MTATSQPGVTSFPASVASAQVLPVNSQREGLLINNMSTTNTLHLSYTSPATAENAWLSLPPGGVFSFDKNLVVPNAIFGVWTGTGGRAAITEFS